RVPARAERIRLCRGAERIYRIPLGGKSKRSTVGFGLRSGTPSGECHYGGNTPGVVAAKAATATIPIVILTAGDPVAAGFAASLNRSGGNLTGVTFLGVEIGRKHFELLREVVPTASTIAFLLNPTNRTLAGPLTRDAEAAARSLGLKLHVLHASTERDIEDAFATLAQLRADALVIG